MDHTKLVYLQMLKLSGKLSGCHCALTDIKVPQTEYLGVRVVDIIVPQADLVRLVKS